MLEFALQFVVAAITLTLSCLLLWPLFRVIRKRPIEGYRLALFLLVGSAVLPFIQVWRPLPTHPVVRLVADVTKSRLEQSLSRLDAPDEQVTTTDPTLRTANAVASKRQLDQPKRGAIDTRAERPSQAGTRRSALAPLASARPAAFQPKEDESQRTPPEPETVASLISSTPKRAAAPESASASLGAWLLGVYLLGVLFYGLRLALRMTQTLRLIQRARPVTEPVLSELWDRVRTQAPGRARLLMTDELAAPVCFGFLRPVVLIPSAVAEQVADGQEHELTRYALAHECIHLRRYDGASLVLQEVFYIAWWFHPAAWWLCRQLNMLRELSCDLEVVESTGGRKRYARALLEYAERMTGPIDRQRPSPSPALLSWAGSSSSLHRRIHMLVDRTSPLSTPLRVGLSSLSLLCVVPLWSGQIAFADALATDDPVTTDAQAGTQDTQHSWWNRAQASDTQKAAAREGAQRSQRASNNKSSAQAAAQEFRIGIQISKDPSLADKLGLPKDKLYSIVRVIPDSIAAHSGLRAKDVFAVVAGKPGCDDQRIGTIKEQLLAGDAVTVHVVRGNDLVEVTMKHEPQRTDASVAEVADAFLQSESTSQDVSNWLRLLSRYQDASSESGIKEDMAWARGLMEKGEFKRALEMYSAVAGGNFQSAKDMLERGALVARSMDRQQLIDLFSEQMQHVDPKALAEIWTRLNARVGAETTDLLGQLAQVGDTAEAHDLLAQAKRYLESAKNGDVASDMGYALSLLRGFEVSEELGLDGRRLQKLKDMIGNQDPEQLLALSRVAISALGDEEIVSRLQEALGSLDGSSRERLVTGIMDRFATEQDVQSDEGVDELRRHIGEQFGQARAGAQRTRDASGDARDSQKAQDRADDRERSDDRDRADRSDARQRVERSATRESAEARDRADQTDARYVRGELIQRGRRGGAETDATVDPRNARIRDLEAKLDAQAKELSELRRQMERMNALAEKLLGDK